MPEQEEYLLTVPPGEVIRRISMRFSSAVNDLRTEMYEYCRNYTELYFDGKVPDEVAAEIQKLGEKCSTE